LRNRQQHGANSNADMLTSACAPLNLRKSRRDRWFRWQSPKKVAAGRAR
jgi:hypothetical protein